MDNTKKPIDEWAVAKIVITILMFALALVGGTVGLIKLITDMQ
jgi:hypothetical protein